MNTALASAVLALGLLATPETPDRPLVEAQINGQPVRLTIDTASRRLIVFAHAADRVGLEYDSPRNPTEPKAGVVFRSRSCRLHVDVPSNSALRIQDAEGYQPLWLTALPLGLHLAGVDGVIGWPNIANNILHLDWGQGVFESLPRVPTWMPPWRNLKLYAPGGLHALAIEVSGPSRSKQAIYIETGDPGGVKVSSVLWREIVAGHPGRPTALEGHYSPVLGCVTERIAWLDRLRLGEIELHDVPVSELSAATQQRQPSCYATIGLYGLTRLELIVDSRHNRAYVRPKDRYPRRYDYNRAGVVFLPVDNDSADLVATVLESGPAYQAGLRTGDQLLRVNGRDVTGWRADPNGVQEGPSAFTQPAGTSLTLAIQRGGQPMEATVILQELLPVPAPVPASTPAPDQQQPLLPEKPAVTAMR